MNVNTPSDKKAMWDEPTVYSSKAAAYAPIMPKLKRFNTCKKDILDKLQDAYKRGPQCEPFNPEKRWATLIRFAANYFWFEIMRQETMFPAERFDRLRQLANALDRAHNLAIRAAYDSTGFDLFGAWCANAKITSAGDFGLAHRAMLDMKKAVEDLDRLKAAAFKAAGQNAVPPKSGRPPLLSIDSFHGLARIYRESTGLRPGRGAGPFADFVFEFIKALNAPDFEFAYDSVIDGIKNAHCRRKPSMFDA